MSQITVTKFRDRSEYRNSAGLLHRTNGPAIEWADGSKLYYQNDQRHRTNGPAIEYANGTKAYWQHGQLHRTNGPAIEYANGTKEYWQNGKQIYPVVLICKNNTPVLAILHQGMFICHK